MKVAIDIGPASRGGMYGMGTYVRELTKHLKGIDAIDFSENFGSLTGKYDILHFTRFRPYFLSLPFSKQKGTKYVLTIYDLIPLIYPKHYPSGTRGWIKWQINKFLIRKYVDKIITISETSKKDICRFIGVEPDKVSVTYLAPPEVYRQVSDRKSLESVVRKYSLPRKFALCDADIYYSKNILNLVKACELARLPLVLVGSGEKTLEFAKSINFNHAELAHLKNVDWDNTHFLSGVEIEDLAKIYNLASVYVQPSFYEGFGIPVLQALACGLPVAVAKNQCHVEILGNEFDYFDPNNPRSIADEILHPNENKKLPREYKWRTAADDTIKVYEKTLAGL